MAEEANKRLDREKVKRVLLLGFVFVSVVMISAIWIEGIIDPEPETPGYYRESFKVDDSIYLTVTADALRYNPQPAGTPNAHDEGEQHQGAGQGQGRGAGQGSGQGSGQSGDGSGH